MCVLLPSDHPSLPTADYWKSPSASLNPADHQRSLLASDHLPTLALDYWRLPITAITCRHPPMTTSDHRYPPIARHCPPITCHCPRCWLVDVGDRRLAATSGSKLQVKGGYRRLEAISSSQRPVSASNQRLAEITSAQ